MKFKSSGILRYSIVGPEYYKLIVEVDPEISKYYSKMVPKYYKCNPQRYLPHITVVRKEVPPILDKWGAYEGKTIVFLYEPEIQYNGIYWWINCYSNFLENIREELGLPVYSKYNSPPDFKRCFHMTVGNSK